MRKRRRDTSVFRRAAKTQIVFELLKILFISFRMILIIFKIELCFD